MKKALIVGINAYPTSPLNGCVNDAASLSSILERNGDGSPNFSVKLETDVATKAELKSLIAELFSGNSDIALLYFSGHGLLNSLGGYIVTPDYKQYDEGVSMDEILTLANGSNAKDKVIILDCCHSGAFGSPAVTGSGAAQINHGVVILTASRESEKSFEVNGHGVFTNLLIDALQGGAADLMGYITPGSVYAYVDQALGPWDQRPVFKTNVSRFTSLRTVKPPIEAGVLRQLTEYFPTPEQEYALDPTYEFDDTVKTRPEDMAQSEHVAIFKNLQKCERVGLVIPVVGEHMYHAAMNSKACKLTALGYHYWRLVKEKRI